MAKVVKKLDTIVYCAIILYLLDIMFLGSGLITRQFGVSTRMLFFLVAVIGCIPGMCLRLKEFVKNKYCITIIIFMIIIGINAVRGVLANNSMPIIISDIKGFLNYFIVFPMLYILTDKTKVLRLIKVFVHSTTVISVVALVLSFYAKFPEGVQNAIYGFVNKYTICGISELSDNVVRVFFHTAGRWFFVGFMFALALSIIERQKKVLWISEMSLLIVGTFVSFTRSSYLGVAVGVLVFIICICVYYKEYFLPLLKNCVVMTIVTMCIIVSMGVVLGDNMFNVAINRCLLAVAETDSGENMSEEVEESSTDSEDAEADNLNIREIRMKMAGENISKSPVFGSGLGTVNDPDGDIIEYFYLDLWSKVGIVGVVIFLLPYVYNLYDIVIRRKRYCSEQRILTISGNIALLYLLIISYFNPCMNTTVGLSIYSLIIAMLVPWKKELALENKKSVNKEA